jgi:hypothetical protein
MLRWFADKDGLPDFYFLHSRCFNQVAVACAFDLLMLNGDDMRRSRLPNESGNETSVPFAQGIQYVEHAEGQRQLRRL